MSVITRRLPVGADLQFDGTTHFRVWAPDPREVRLVIAGADGQTRHVAMDREDQGYFTTHVDSAPAGTRYWYLLDGDRAADPASRFQPEGPFGPSAVVDASSFAWTDVGWRGVPLSQYVIYELHVGTFTPEGTWAAAAARLPDLRDIGITVIEVMPVSEFPGRFGWGYDGVFPYAPTRLYGTPDDCRAFVNRAHELGIGVILDVVYNHLGPAGSVFSRYARHYFSERYKGEWGDPLNFDGHGSGPVREYFASNGEYWISEFHFDGLRLDATQGVHDASPEHILAELGRRARAAAPGRTISLIAENEPQETRLVRPATEGGFGLDALWNDDFHHSIVVALTGRAEAYYSDHRGTAQELLSAAKYGYLFQGQHYAWQSQVRGTPARGIPHRAFVTFLENHDQVANSGDGSRLRLRSSPGRYRAASALLALMPGTPMLFQGQEFGATTPFFYFADHEAELAAAVARGRVEFISQFPSLATPEGCAVIPAPHDVATFERSRLNWSERETNQTFARLYRDLFAIRRSDRAFDGHADIDGAVLREDLFVLRYFASAADDDRLLVVNMGGDFDAGSIADPLVAPPFRGSWRVRWSSEHPDYGGLGTPLVVRPNGGWHVAGESAVLLEPERAGR